MIKHSCSHCGSAEFTLSDFQPKDFPGGIFFVECSRCHQPRGVVHLHTLVDSARSFDAGTSRPARALLSHMSADSPADPSL